MHNNNPDVVSDSVQQKGLRKGAGGDEPHDIWSKTHASPSFMSSSTPGLVSICDSSSGRSLVRKSESRSASCSAAGIAAVYSLAKRKAPGTTMKAAPPLSTLLRQVTTWWTFCCGTVA